MIGNDAEGLLYEVKALEYLQENGYNIIDRGVNYPKIGELDIVAMEGEILVIVEVKYRKNDEFGHPIESITRPKIKRILAATREFLKSTKQKYTAIRFDVVCFLGDVLEHVEDAFYGDWN